MPNGITAWWDRSAAAWRRHFDSFDPKELKEALSDAKEITKAAATGVVTTKTASAIKRLLQGLFRDLDRLAERHNVTVQSLGRGKFILTGNPHSYFVEFFELFGPLHDVPGFIDRAVKGEIERVRKAGELAQHFGTTVQASIGRGGPIRQPGPTDFVEFRLIRQGFDALFGALRSLSTPAGGLGPGAQRMWDAIAIAEAEEHGRQARLAGDE